jgi:DNA-binding NarL/FixJ family response regulator
VNAELYAIAAAAAIASGDESRAEVRIANTLSLCAQAGTVLPVALLPGRHRSAFLVRSSDASSWDDVLDGQVLLDRLRDLPGVFPGDGLLVDLTRREREVLSSLAETSSMAELATLFTLSLSTVKKQVNAIYRKLRVHTRSEALTTATELGLLRLRPDLGVTGSQSWDEQSTVVAQSTRSANAIRTGPNRLPGGGSRY